MLVSFNWLKEYLGDTKLSAQEAADLLGAHAFEIEGIKEKGSDTVIDVDILPNRSSDCLCHRGIARELASITNTPLANDPLSETPELSDLDTIVIDIADKEACPRFAASLITGLEVKESPAWLKARLEAIGQRPINNIVDATNYVMFAIGQPIHAYDAELFPQVDGKWQFNVRFAEAGESVSLIPEGGKDEERVVECQGTELLIVDGSSNTPIGLAGVKGGSFAGVHDKTTKVIIETAHFHPTITRKTARRLGIVIDASKRFENEPSRELIPYTQQAVCDLITEIAGGQYEGTVDVYPESVENPTVEVPVMQTKKLLGLELTAEEIADILERIGAEVSLNSETVSAKGPWERTDLQIAEDFIEEVGRINGYEHVSAVAPAKSELPELNQRHYYSEKIRQLLIAEGFSEVITSSFRKKDTVQLKNALASDKSCLRSSLIKNISEALDKNASFTDLLGMPDTRLFEIGTVFYKAGDKLTEHIALTIGVRVKPAGYTGKEDKIITHLKTVLSDGLGVAIDGTSEKGVLELNLTELLKKLPEPTAYEPVGVSEEITYQPFSVYQHMSRDIAMWVKAGTTAEAVEAVLNTAAGDLRVRTTQFDEFTKDGRTSLGFRLVFQSPEKTLTDEVVNAVMDKVYNAVQEQGWEVR
jgi:phenylalanyl-tRNA synthetase beta chain